MLAELGSLTLIAEKTDHHMETHIKGQAGGSLLKSRRFLPLFLVEFLGAFNDNVFKNALVMLMTFKLAATMGWGETTTINMKKGSKKGKRGQSLPKKGVSPCLLTCRKESDRNFPCRERSGGNLLAAFIT